MIKLPFIPPDRRSAISLDGLVSDGVVPAELAKIIKQYFQGGQLYVAKEDTPTDAMRAEQREEAYRRLVLYKEPVAAVARELPHGGVSRTTIYRWIKEWKNDEVCEGLGHEQASSDKDC